MTFTSPVFLVCLVPFVVLFHISATRFRPLILVLTSATFYAALDPRWALLLAGLTTLTFYTAQRLVLSNDRRSLLLGSSVVGLLSVLAFFKYAPQLAHPLAAPQARMFDRILLPLGISYYTFKLLSYLIDVYWGKLDPEEDFLAFAAYASFLPQLPFGPIQRAGDFLTKLRGTPTPLSSGFRLILFGMFQKLVIADRAAEWVDPVFADGGVTLDPVSAVVAVYAYAIQLYADFSGISDIAIGLGRLFGIESPANFRSPYFAESLPEFWRRWHISMTSWINDYVFVPLRMSTRNWGTLGLAASLMVNMLLIALWHAASLSLLIFGALHGALMVLSVVTKKRRDAWFKARPSLRDARAIWGPVLTFHTVAISLVIFRAPSFAVARRVLRQAGVGVERLLTHTPTDWIRVLFVDPAHLKDYREDLVLVVLGLLVMAIAHGKPMIARWILTRPAWFRWGWYYLAVLMLLVLAKTGGTGFIYAHF